MTTEALVDYKATNGQLTALGWVTYAEDSAGNWTIVAGADPSSRELNDETKVELNGNSKGNSEATILSLDVPIEMGLDVTRLTTNLVPIGSIAVNGDKAPEEPALDRPEAIKLCP